MSNRTSSWRATTEGRPVRKSRSQRQFDRNERQRLLELRERRQTGEESAEWLEGLTVDTSALTARPVGANRGR